MIIDVYKENEALKAENERLSCLLARTLLKVQDLEDEIKSLKEPKKCSVFKLNTIQK